VTTLKKIWRPQERRDAILFVVIFGVAAAGFLAEAYLAAIVIALLTAEAVPAWMLFEACLLFFRNVHLAP